MCQEGFESRDTFVKRNIFESNIMNGAWTAKRFCCLLNGFKMMYTLPLLENLEIRLFNGIHAGHCCVFCDDWPIKRAMYHVAIIPSS